MGMIHSGGTARWGSRLETILNPGKLRKDFNSRGRRNQQPHLSNAVLSVTSSQRLAPWFRMLGSLLLECWIREPIVIF